MSPAVTSKRRLWTQILGKLALTLALGTAGGALMTWLGAPASWLSGAMLAVAVANLSGLPVAVPDRVRSGVFVLLGTSIGSAVTPEALAQMQAWPGSFAVLTFAVVIMTGASTAHLIRIRGWDRSTARFSSIPGALGQVLILAMRANADLPRIALAQSLRVFVLVALMPWLLTGTGHGSTANPATIVTTSLGGSILVLGASGVLGLLLERFRVPAGALLGAMIASAVLHGTGLVTGRLPGLLLDFGFIATGCVIGVRFGAVTIAMVRGTVRGALESVMLALVLSALFAFLAQRWLGLPFGQLWMAYAPGGVEAMTIMSFALGLDPAFVGAHHVVRLIVINIIVPVWLRNTTKPPTGPLQD